MIWNSWGDFFAMGGYALYVWGSVLAVAVCLALELLAVRLRGKAIRSLLVLRKAVIDAQGRTSAKDSA